MKPKNTPLTSSIFTVLWLGLAGLVFFWNPFHSDSHHSDTHRIAFASGIVICIALNIGLLWFEPKNQKVSDFLTRGLGWVGFVLILGYL